MGRPTPDDARASDGTRSSDSPFIVYAFLRLSVRAFVRTAIRSDASVGSSQSNRMTNVSNTRRQHLYDKYSRLSRRETRANSTLPSRLAGLALREEPDETRPHVSLRTKVKVQAREAARACWGLTARTCPRTSASRARARAVGPTGQHGTGGRGAGAQCVRPIHSRCCVPVTTGAQVRGGTSRTHARRERLHVRSHMLVSVGVSHPGEAGSLARPQRRAGGAHCGARGGGSRLASLGRAAALGDPY